MYLNLTPSFFYQARWFAAKNADIMKIDPIDAVKISYKGSDLTLSLVRVHLSHQGSVFYQDYFIPLWNDFMRDEDVFTESFGLAVGYLVEENTVYRGENGVFSFKNLGSRPWRVRKLGSTSNSLLFLHQEILVKSYRLLPKGINPELEMFLALRDTPAAQMLPDVLGYVEYQSSAGECYTLMLLQEGVVNEGTGWQYFLRRGKHHLLVKDKRHREAYGEDKAEAFNLGLMTAIFHRQLSLVNQQEFIPEPWKFDEAETWLTKKVDELSHLVPNLMGKHNHIWFDRLTAVSKRLCKNYNLWGKRQRCHGDYHLEQVLRTPRGFMVTDLEGEPLLTGEKRREKHSPCKDLAGMLRSFSYVTAVAAMEMAEEWGKPGRWNDLRKNLLPWQESLKRAFMEGYLSENKTSPCLPSPEVLDQLLKFFILEKAVYELKYEQGHRPAWAVIPRAGIEEALRGLIH